MTKITNAAIVGIGETKLDKSILYSEIDIEGYDLLRLDRSRRGGGVACYVKKSLAYNYRDNFCKNTESIFSDIFLPKTKPIVIGILYRPPDKNDFVKNLEETFKLFNVVNVKLTEHGRIHKIFHVTDIENLLETDNLEEYINNASF